VMHGWPCGLGLTAVAQSTCLLTLLSAPFTYSPLAAGALLVR